MGAESVALVLEEPYFIAFLRDAPEATGASPALILIFFFFSHQINILFFFYYFPIKSSFYIEVNWLIIKHYICFSNLFEADKFMT